MTQTPLLFHPVKLSLTFKIHIEKIKYSVLWKRENIRNRQCYCPKRAEEQLLSVLDDSKQTMVMNLWGLFNTQSFPKARVYCHTDGRFPSPRMRVLFSKTILHLYFNLPWHKGWTSSPPEVPSNPYHFVTFPNLHKLQWAHLCCTAMTHTVSSIYFCGCTSISFSLWLQKGLDTVLPVQ